MTCACTVSVPHSGWDSPAQITRFLFQYLQEAATEHLTQGMACTRGTACCGSMLFPGRGRCSACWLLPCCRCCICKYNRTRTCWVASGSSHCGMHGMLPTLQVHCRTSCQPGSPGFMQMRCSFCQVASHMPRGLLLFIGVLT
jgi:hypothetical protein